jgi:hypothetical protein
VSLARVEPIADAVLFEGYLLYPYRASALKNRHRWTFGVLCPRATSEAHGGREPWWSQSECLVAGEASTEIEIVLRLLHPMRRLRRRGEGWLEAGEEASVVRVESGPLRLDELTGDGVCRPFGAAGREEIDKGEPGSGERDGVLLRRQEPLEGSLAIAAERLDGDAYRLTVRVANVTPAEGEAPHQGLRSFASTHWLIGVRRGRLVSLLDPPPPLHAAAVGCRNVGVWPVLVGIPGEDSSALCSPIILDDYPAIAPESPGETFDGTEIDELLALRILTLTAEERRSMAADDPRAGALLARTESLRPAEVQRLHGAFRRRAGFRALAAGGGPALAPGDRVRLRPQGRRDIFDLALAGRAATILSIEQDYEDRVYFTVTVDDDPGKDLGAEGKPGHRFFFTPDEVEPLAGP